MKETGIKNLVFDFGNVLVNLDKARCIRRFEQLGIQNVEELINDSFKEGFFQSQEQGLITSAEFRDHIRELTDKPVSDDDIDDAWNSFLGVIPPEKLMMLLELRKTYMVYLLSNTNEIHWKYSCKHIFPYNGFTINNYFEKFYLSYEMKLVKPDIRIFKTMINDAGIDPSETLFIDDSVDNCLAAESIGISSYVASPDRDWRELFKKEQAI